LQFIERDQPLIVRSDQVIQHFCFRSFCQAHTIGERPLIVREPFSDIPRARTDRVTQPLDRPVMALEVRRQEKEVDAQIE